MFIFLRLYKVLGSFWCPFYVLCIYWLAGLADLDGSPQVVVVSSYDAFADGAGTDDCAATAGPDGVPGLDEDGLALLEERTRRFDEVLSVGAEAYGFTMVRPVLTPLCAPADALLGPDLQDLEAPYPFHPTAVGMIRLGAAVFAALPAPEGAP